MAFLSTGVFDILVDASNPCFMISIICVQCVDNDNNLDYLINAYMLFSNSRSYFLG